MKTRQEKLNIRFCTKGNYSKIEKLQWHLQTAKKLLKNINYVESSSDSFIFPPRNLAEIVIFDPVEMPKSEPVPAKNWDFLKSGIKNTRADPFSSYMEITMI